MIRLLTMATALLFTGSCRSGLPRFGTARFGEAVFGQASLARMHTRSLHAPMGNHHPRSHVVGCGLSDAF